MAVLGRWSGGSIAIGNFPETWTTSTTDLFPTQERNDSSAYGHGSANTFTLPSSGLADGYLFVGAFEFEDSSNGRYNPQGQIIQSGGTGTFVGGPTGGYSRDNSEDRSYVRCWAFVDAPSASAEFEFQIKADSDDSGTDSTVRSEFQIIPLYYADIGLYTSTSSSLYGGTTPNQVTGFSGTDGTNITLSSDVVSVTGDNKNYLVLGSQFFEGRGGRTQRWHGLDIDSSQENAAKAYSYYRNSSNDESGDLFTWLIQTSTSTVTIEQTCYRGDGVLNDQGGADSDGSTPGVGDHALVVIELNDSAEVFVSSSNAASSNFATTGPVDCSPFPSANFSGDSGSFTRATDSAVNAESAMDALLGFNVSAASGAVSSGSRWTAYAEMTVNGTEDSDSFAGDYLRNNQGNIDTFGWSANLLGFQALSQNDDIGVSVTELSGSEGGGGDVASPSGWIGAWGVNLDTLEDGSTDALLANDVESTTEVDTPSVGQEHGLTATSIESSAEASSPSLGQEHALTATSVEATSEVSAPAAAETHALTADSIESASEIDNPNIGQEHALTATGTESAAELSAPSLGQEHGLLSSSVESASELSSPSVGQEHALLADDVESASEVTAPTVGQEHALTATSVESAAEVSAPAVTESNILAAESVEATSEVGAPTLGQEHALLADSVESAAELTLPSVGQEHTLLADNAESVSELSAPSLVAVSGTDDLLANDIESLSEITSPVVGQIHALLADDIESMTELAAPELSDFGPAQQIALSRTINSSIAISRSMNISMSLNRTITL